jgi:Kef-type K+ transport system membrane component KefB
MSASAKSWQRRGIQVASLALVLAVLVVAGKLRSSAGAPGSTAAGLGLLLLLGVLLSEVLDLFRLPHLTGYLAAGALAGPHVLEMVDHDTIEVLSRVNTLALTLIALAGGLELRVDTLREVRSSLAKATLVHSTIGFFGAVTAFLVVRPFIPTLNEVPAAAGFGIALLWGGLAISRSPSATLAILSQVRPSGPLTRFSLAFIMSSDIVVVLCMAAAMVVARPLIEPGATISLDSFRALGFEIYGSVCVGTTLALLLAIYLRFVGSYLILVLVLLGFGFSEGIRYIHLDPLLTFLTAGFVVQNLSTGGDKLLHAIEETGAIVFVVFFAMAGAHLDLPLLRRLWPVALGLVASRALITIACHYVASRWSRDIPAVRRWGWSSMISQAGLTLGLSLVVERAYPVFGPAFRALVIATVAMNEVVGPIVFKLGLDRAGETGGVREVLPS